MSWPNSVELTMKGYIDVTNRYECAPVFAIIDRLVAYTSRYLICL